MATSPSGSRAPTNIGLVGMGLVGKALIQRLQAAGYGVVGYDVDAQAQQAAAAAGVTVTDTAAQVARHAAVILLSLPDSDVVNEVLWGTDGIAASLQPAATILDTTTGRPQDARDNARKLADRGVRFVDVTLSGSSDMIARGQATALVGDAEQRACYRPVIEAFAARLFFLGQPGAGCLAKLVVNLVMGLNRVALAEGLALAHKAGLDPAHTLQVLKESAAYSRVMDIKGQRMIEGDFQPAGRLAQHAKDVRLIIELAEEVGASVPLSQAHARILARAIQAGCGDLDNSAVIKVYQEPAAR